MDWSKAIHYALMVKAAEQVAPQACSTPDLLIGQADTTLRYTVLGTLYANDLATDNSGAASCLPVSIGCIAQSEAGDVVIAIRGTYGIHEWLHDLHYGAVPCPFLPEAGLTEDGFTQMYQSLRLSPDPESPSLRDAFVALALPQPQRSLTICGHSLGAALATLLALDLVANTPHTDLALYTYASPRTGDTHFAATFNRMVPNTVRIANRLDLVTETPPLLLCHHAPYEHVESSTVLIPGKEVGHHVVCMHHLVTYLYLMGVEAGVQKVHPLLPDCCRAQEPGWIHLLERHHQPGTAQANSAQPWRMPSVQEQPQS